MSWIISEINIQGIKGVLDQSGDFKLSIKNKPRSIAVFAPNGCGKSGYADAIEYLFSEDGMVEHLGKGGVDSERGGKHALPHVLAEERGVSSQVAISLINTSTGRVLNTTRQVKTGRTDNMPLELTSVIQLAPAHRVLRQHDLRRFVVEMSPGDKYSELSRWIGLTKLEQVLKHLVTATNVLHNADLDREIEERVKDIGNNTDNEIKTNDLPLILLWCANHAETFLGTKPDIHKIDDLFLLINELNGARDALILASGTAETNEAKKNLEKDLPKIIGDEGALADLLSAFNNALEAEKTYLVTQENAKNSVFNEVWTVSKDLLIKTPLETCPICKTEWSKTELGDQSAAIIWLQDSLQDLSEFIEAGKKQQTTYQIYKTTLASLIKSLCAIVYNLNYLKAETTISEIQSTILQSKSIQEHTGLLKDLDKDIQALLDKIRLIFSDATISEIVKLESNNLPENVTKIDQLVKRIENLKITMQRLDELEVERQEYRKVEQNFNVISTIITERSAQLVNQIVDAFQGDVLSIYQTIHPNSKVPNIYIKPNTEERTLELRIDFHQPGRKVPPAGYLSESYINTLGLALFISSARLFNREFPFIFLDDIVSSYDADHRLRIVDLIAEQLNDFQVFLTTHDHQFYKLLKERLDDKGWNFEKITAWDFDHGPKRETDTIRPDVISQLISNGDPSTAGNAIRQYMEDWLDKKCAMYCVYTVHKRGSKDFDRTLFDYWDPFIKRLKAIKGGFFVKQIDSQRCFERLKSHSILNYYSHSQAHPYEWATMGDVEYVWTEFQEFEKLFICAACGKQLKYDREEERVYCPCGGQIFKP